MAKRPPNLRKASLRAARGGGNERALATTPYQTQGAYGAPGSGIETGTGADWFGPLNPMAPTAPPQVSGRLFDFPAGYNLNVQPKAYEPIGFGTLRSFADSYDLLRLVIETRKDQIARMKWNIKPRDPKKPVQGEIKARIEKIEKFFLRPDRVHFWDAWLRQLLEDLFVLDAPTLHVRRTRGGELYSLEQIDGGSVKRVIDDWGRTPDAPTAAYQQVLKGFPAVDYMAHSAESKRVWTPSGPQELIYRPRNLRVNRVYGYSPVEQIIMTINIGLRREVFQLNYFTEGTIPEALIGVPEQWTPDQIRQFQEWFDSILQGNLAERRRARFVPSAVAKTYIETKSGELFGKAEEWLIRVICFAFSVSPQPFIQQMNRATAESAQETAVAEGLAPLQNWVKNLIDSIIIDEFGYDDLEFGWQDEQEPDPKAQMEILTGYSGKGAITLNEVRASMGLDPYPEDIYNKPMVMTSVGYVPINPDDVTGRVTPTVTDAPKLKDDNQPETEEAETEKVAGGRLAKSGKTTTPILLNRPRVTRSEASLEKALKKKLTKIGADIGAQVEKFLGKLGKADEPEIDPDDILSAIDWDLFEELEDDFIDDLAAVAKDSARLAIAQVGIEVTSKLTGIVNLRAADWAVRHAGELISVDGDETLVSATRNMIRSTIAEGIASGATAEEIADAVQEAYAFSVERATIIAQTEVARANSYGALEGYREAGSMGLTIRKEWLDLETACEECVANAQAGPIELDAAFPSGDEAPPAHPHCRCVISPVVEE